MMSSNYRISTDRKITEYNMVINTLAQEIKILKQERQQHLEKSRYKMQELML